MKARRWAVGEEKGRGREKQVEFLLGKKKNPRESKKKKKRKKLKEKLAKLFSFGGREVEKRERAPWKERRKETKWFLFGEIAESFKGGLSLYASFFSLSLVSLCIHGFKFSSMKECFDSWFQWFPFNNTFVH